MKRNFERELVALQKMTAGQLQERYAQVYGEAARSRHRGYLIRKIAWRIQALDEGDLTERARRRAEELADDSYVRTTPPRECEAMLDLTPIPTREAAATAKDDRLPPVGTAIEREYKGQKYRVLVRSDGLEYDGQRFRSLSAIAKVITGSHVNGYRFFHLDGGAST